jgi:hypothetical protein
MTTPAAILNGEVAVPASAQSFLDAVRDAKARRSLPSLPLPTRIAFVGNYLPRQCGIATFTTDLCTALAANTAAAAVCHSRQRSGVELRVSGAGAPGT